MSEIIFPKRNTRFRLDDFFQTEVDEFMDGNFLFLSGKKIKIKTDKRLMELIQTVDEYGYLISTYCYTNEQYYKLLVCDYKANPWKNNYIIRGLLSIKNDADGYAVHSSITDFLEWMDFTIK